jgi:hypothetical protein
MRKLLLLAVTLTLILGAWFSIAQAQDPTPPAPDAETVAEDIHDHHSMKPQKLIQGSEHPEMIPDVVAYRLYFVALNEGDEAAPSTSTWRRIKLHQAGIGKAQDLDKAEAILLEFKAKYEQLVTTYNESVGADRAAGKQPDHLAFMNKLNALVNATRGRLKNELPQEALQKFEPYVQNEKKLMVISDPSDSPTMMEVQQ